MEAVTLLALEDELFKIANEPEIFGDSTEYRGLQDVHGPPVQDWHRRGRRRMAKQADVRSAIQKGTKLLKAAPRKLNQMSLQGMARLQSHPVGSKLLHHVLDPSNTVDISSTVGNLFF